MIVVEENRRSMFMSLSKQRSSLSWTFIFNCNLFTTIWISNFDVTFVNRLNILIWMSFCKKWKMSKRFDEIWVSEIVAIMLIIVLRIIFVSNNKIRMIIVLKMKKIFRKKIITMISIMNIHSSTISNSSRVKRNFLSFINSTISHIRIEFIKINQIIVNNQDRRRLKQINHT